MIKLSFVHIVCVPWRSALRPVRSVPRVTATQCIRGVNVPLTRLEEVAHARLPARRNVADERVVERTSWSRGVVQVVERSGVQRVRQGGDASRQPHSDDGPSCPRQSGHGVGSQWVTDGRVALHREGGDGQDRRRRSHLGEESLEEAVRLTEAPRVRLPDRVQLRRKTCTAQSDTRHHDHNHQQILKWPKRLKLNCKDHCMGQEHNSQVSEMSEKVTAAAK